MKRIDQIDPNFNLQGIVPQEYQFHSPHEAPFSIYGLAPNKENTLCRLPLDWLPRMSDGVQNLSWHLAGGVVRFTTDSPGLALVWKLKGAGVMPHFTACGQSGMELFEETEQGVQQVRNFLPQMNDGCGCRLNQTSYTDLPGGLRHYALYLPLYNGLEELLIGISPGAQLLPGRAPKLSKPILFYGSSITQGGCATKCGSCYTHILCRRLDAAHINLGFAGNAKAEPAMAEYIASQSMSAFVMDYDHNAPDADYLAKTHQPFFRIIRKAQPELPILLVSKPDYDKSPPMAQKRREVIRHTYEAALAEGDQHIWMLDGQTLFGESDRDLCTVDGTHPNDLGFLRMADAIEPILRKMLHQEEKP